MKKKPVLIAAGALACALVFVGCSAAKNNTDTTGNTETAGETTTTAPAPANSTAPSASGQFNKGNPSPDFTLTDMNGNTVTLADFKGKKVAIKFWASWCSVCKETLPASSTLADDTSKDFEYISIVAPGVSDEMSEEKFKEWYASRKYNHMPVYFDKDGTFMRTLGVRAFPSTATIGTDGIMVHFQVGHVSSDILKEAMSKIK